MTKDQLLKLLSSAKKKGASDIHLVSGAPPYFRVHGELYPVKSPILTNASAKKIVSILVDKDQEALLKKEGDVDLGIVFNGINMRINIHHQMDGVGIAIRLIPDKIPSAEELRLERVMIDIVDKKSGLIIISGAAGVGKSTTLASMVQRINDRSKRHIVTLEDPIEYRFPKGRALIEQRQLGMHFSSFNSGLKHALRQDPNVLVVGEMRDPESIELALTAAETGHLVISTLHAPNTAEVIERIVNIFDGPKQQQILVQLSSSLQMIVAQALLPAKDGKRVAAREILISTNAIQNAIRQNNLSTIRSAVSMGKKVGMQSMDQAIEELKQKGLI